MSSFFPVAAAFSPSGDPVGRVTPTSPDDHPLEGATLRVHDLAVKLGPCLGKGASSQVYACGEENVLKVQTFSTKKYTPKSMLRLANNELVRGVECRYLPNMLGAERGLSICEHPALLMRKGAGSSLSGFVKQRNERPFTPFELKAIAKGIFEALEAMEAHDISHLDIKPDNVFVNREANTVEMLDLGLAEKDHARLPYSFLASQKQTPNYRDPLMILGEKHINPDIWSVGCLLFEIATGKLLFSLPAHSSVIETTPTGPLRHHLPEPTRVIVEVMKTLRRMPPPSVQMLEGFSSIFEVEGSTVSFNHPVSTYARSLDGFVDYPAEIAKLDPLLKDLIEKTLSLDPYKRISTYEVLEHSYLREVRSFSLSIPSDPSDVVVAIYNPEKRLKPLATTATLKAPLLPKLLLHVPELPSYEVRIFDKQKIYVQKGVKIDERTKFVYNRATHRLELPVASARCSCM